MSPWFGRLVFLLALLPLAVLIWTGTNDQFGPDPAEALMHATGEWAARLLLLTLLVSPLREWFAMPALLQLRRMLGLYVFFYACLHLLLFLHFYLGWTTAQLFEELIERPYISVGALAWLILLPMAVTSARTIRRRMGRHWARLHQGIYVVAVLVSLHILWQVRSDFGEALLYSLLFGSLLMWRLLRFWKQRLASQ